MPDVKRPDIQKNDDEHSVERFYQEGCRLYNAGHYAEAAERFRLGSNSQHAPSKNNLGFLYINGQGVPKDLNRGVSLVDEAANLGARAAIYHRAAIHIENKQYSAAHKRLLSLHSGEDHCASAANFNLAELYIEGLGVPRDASKGWRLMEIAAEGGVAEAQYRLGMKLVKSILPEDKAEGKDWLGRAAAQNHDEAVREVAKLKPALAIGNRPAVLFGRRRGHPYSRPVTH